MSNFEALGENLYHSTNEMPILSQHLAHISETTAEGVTKVMDNAEGIMNKSMELGEKLGNLKEKFPEASADIDEIINGASTEIQNQAFGILTALEFEDINRQQIEKISSALNDFQDEFYRLLVLLKLKDYMERKEHDRDVISELKQVVDLEAEGESKQDLIDELFKEFGL